MPLQKLQFRPGVNREGTTLANEGGWFESDKIRFRSGYPEKIGGWVLDTGTTASTLQPSTGAYFGVCRSLWNWTTLSGDNLLGVGTNLKYYIEKGGVYNDITPITTVTSFSNVISTGFTTLVSGISGNATSLQLANATYFPENNGLIRIDYEDIYYAARTSNVATGVIRGFNNTLPVPHDAGANVSSAFIYVNDKKVWNVDSIFTC